MNDISEDFWTDLLTWLDANVYHPINNPSGGIELMTMSQWYNRTVGRPGCMRMGVDGGAYATDGAGENKLVM